MPPLAWSGYVAVRLIFSFLCDVVKTFQYHLSSKRGDLDGSPSLFSKANLT